MNEEQHLPEDFCFFDKLPVDTETMKQLEAIYDAIGTYGNPRAEGNQC